MIRCRFSTLGAISLLWLVGCTSLDDDERPPPAGTIEGEVAGIGFPGEISWAGAPVVVESSDGSITARTNADDDGSFELELEATPADGTFLTLVAVHPEEPDRHLPLFSLLQAREGELVGFPGAADGEVGGDIALSGTTTAAALLYYPGSDEQSMEDFIESVRPLLATIDVSSELGYVTSVSDIGWSYGQTLPSPDSTSEFAMTPLDQCLCEGASNGATKIRSTNQVQSGLEFLGGVMNLGVQGAISWLTIQATLNELPLTGPGVASSASVDACSLEKAAGRLETIGVGNCAEHSIYTANWAATKCRDKGAEQVLIVRGLAAGKHDGHQWTVVSTLPKATFDLTYLVHYKDGSGQHKFLYQGRELTEAESSSLHYSDSWAVGGNPSIEPCGAYDGQFMKNSSLDNWINTKEVKLPETSGATCQKPVRPDEGSFSKCSCKGPCTTLCVDGEAADECGGCEEGQICQNGSCVDATGDNSCAGREPSCCPGRDDSCTAASAGCFCDAYCTEAGDCCPDSCTTCGYCQ